MNNCPEKNKFAAISKEEMIQTSNRILNEIKSYLKSDDINGLRSYFDLYLDGFLDLFPNIYFKQLKIKFMIYIACRNFEMADELYKSEIYSFHSKLNTDVKHCLFFEQCLKGETPVNIDDLDEEKNIFLSMIYKPILSYLAFSSGVSICNFGENDLDINENLDFYEKGITDKNYDNKQISNGHSYEGISYNYTNLNNKTSVVRKGGSFNYPDNDKMIVDEDYQICVEDPTNDFASHNYFENSDNNFKFKEDSTNYSNIKLNLIDPIKDTSSNYYTYSKYSSKANAKVCSDIRSNKTKSSKIKVFQPVFDKKENIDKKIIRRFRLYLVDGYKTKAIKFDDLECIDKHFWKMFIMDNFLPPFKLNDVLTGEMVEFKSFSNKFFEWLFNKLGAKYLYELFLSSQGNDVYNNFVSNNSKLSSNDEEKRKLLKYLNHMPEFYSNFSKNFLSESTLKDDFSKTYILPHEERTKEIMDDHIDNCEIKSVNNLKLFETDINTLSINLETPNKENKLPNTSNDLENTQNELIIDNRIMNRLNNRFKNIRRRNSSNNRKRNRSLERSRDYEFLVFPDEYPELAKATFPDEMNLILDLKFIDDTIDDIHIVSKENKEKSDDPEE